MSKELAEQITENIKPEQIAQFLTDHPNFFLEQKDILAELTLPHKNGEVSSLLERQISVLRERNNEMRHRLNEILEQGQRNDVLFNKTRSLLLNLLDTKSLNDLSARLNDYCASEFQVDKVLFSLFDDPKTYQTSQCRVASAQDAEQAIPTLLSSPDCISGAFRTEEYQFLFAGNPENIQSAIVLPVRIEGKVIAMLAMGADDPHYFVAGTDTMFLRFIGDVISKILPRFLY